MNLIRKIKINKITEVNFTEKEKEIIDFVNSMLSDLIPFKHDDYPESIFYFKGDKWVLEQDNVYHVLRVRYNIFWSVLEKKYLLLFNEIQYILKYMIEESFKQKVTTPVVGSNAIVNIIEEEFKIKVFNPLGAGRSSFPLVDKAFKHNISTPKSAISNIKPIVKFNLKKGY